MSPGDNVPRVRLYLYHGRFDLYSGQSPFGIRKRDWEYRYGLESEWHVPSSYCEGSEFTILLEILKCLLNLDPIENVQNEH
uniref:Uncharacterized protein n=1 Tax=Moniliophthora roreri TaxID=221103 RepID=A0A0W0F1G6_MONRR